MQSVTGNNAAEEQREFIQAVMEGLADIESGRELSLDEVKKRLGGSRSCRDAIAINCQVSRKEP